MLAEFAVQLRQENSRGVVAVGAGAPGALAGELGGSGAAEAW